MIKAYALKQERVLGGHVYGIPSNKVLSSKNPRLQVKVIFGSSCRRVPQSKQSCKNHKGIEPLERRSESKQ